MPHVSRGPVRIHYRAFGSPGDAVVLLQGLGLSSRYWFDVPDQLAARAPRGFHVVTPDNRGTGKSDKPRGAYRMRELADDVAAVLDHAGIDRAYVLGISLGGMIAQEVALRHSDRVRGLALLATTPGLPHGRLPPPRSLASLLSIPFVRKRGGPATALYRLVLAERHVGQADELLSRWPAAMAEDPIVMHGFFGQFAAAALHSTGARLGRLRCPAVVVTGDEDVLIPSRNSEILARRIPRARLRVLPQMGHGIPIADPGVVERALDELRELEAS